MYYLFCSAVRNGPGWGALAWCAGLLLLLLIFENQLFVMVAMLCYISSIFLSVSAFPNKK